MENKVLLVSFVSDQTIPNVQIIKEFKDVTDYLFITTEGMEKKGARLWIENTCKVSAQKPLIVNEYSFKDIYEKLKSFDFDAFDKIYVNLTGGTKIMTMVAGDFFNEIGADIFYVTGKNNEYIKVYPKNNNPSLVFNEKITLADYLHAYGFTFPDPKPAMQPLDAAKSILELFCSNERLDYFMETFSYLQTKRSKDKGILIDDTYHLRELLEEIDFKPSDPCKLSKYEIKYLTGEWFEEYVGLTIKSELKLADNDIFIGTELSKVIGSSVEKNDAHKLLGEDATISNDDFTNEMDVMFMYEGGFYSIECKSSILADKVVTGNNGQLINKKYNILGETIYKSDSLKNKFGLYPKTTIMTLTDFHDYWSQADSASKRNNRVREMEGFINRANLSNIKIVDRKMLVESSSLFELIKK